MNGDSEGSTKSTKENGGDGNITLQDVLDLNPKEDKAETRLLQSIEQEDDEEKGNMSAGILTGVPEDGSHVFQPASKKSLKEAPKSFFSGESSAKTIEESLHGLTSEMKGNNDEDQNKQMESKSQADVFANNASKLMEKAYKKVGNGTSTSYQELRSFLSFHRQSMRQYIRMVLLYLILPGLALVCLLFYAFGNPGGNDPSKASASWWINFCFVRLVLTFSLAKGAEALIVDFCCLKTSISMTLLGPYFTLVLLQSKGWPFQLLMWCVFNFAMLYGNNDFARHWLFYQDAIKVFNAENSAGNVTGSESWREFLISAMVIGGFVCLKRFFVSLWYGQALYRRYGKELANVMASAVLIGKVAALAKNKEAMSRAQHFDLDFEKYKREEDHVDESDTDTDGLTSSKFLINANRRDMYGNGLSQTQQAIIRDLLGDWEEPTTDERKVESVPISAIVQFRAAAGCVDKDYPFSQSFGLANSRENSIISSQKLFVRLVKQSDSDSDSGFLNFDTIALVALHEDGTLDEKKLKNLIGIFRPTRDGKITMLEFVKSIDTVYKDLRVLRASIHNAQKMNAASQKLVNALFYFLLLWIVLAIFDIDPGAFFVGVVTAVVGFAFMIGDATAKLFEGLLLVLCRKPYDIGDRIAVSPVEDDVSGFGSSGWIVKDLDLFKTTVIFGETNEEATYFNGSLSDSRIINHNRSQKAVLSFTVKFGVDVEKEKVDAFRNSVEQFVKNRPREWLAFLSFRLSTVAPEEGFVEYKVVLQHREGWQQIGALEFSKSNVELYAYELSKEMGICM